MTPTNLQQILDQNDPVELLRNSQIGAYIYPVVPAEFTNWRREQRAWRETAVLYDQSHHMVNLFIRGTDALELISDTAINSVRELPGRTWPSSTCRRRRRARHRRRHPLPRGRGRVHVRRPRAGLELAAVPGRGGRLQDVDVALDDRSPSRPMGKAVTRKLYRFQIQGPNAWAVIEKLNGGPLEEVKFFHMG